jgi:hypothetical protein
MKNAYPIIRLAAALLSLGFLAYFAAEGLNKFQGITAQSTRERVKRQQEKYNRWGLYIGKQSALMAPNRSLSHEDEQRE